MAGKPDNAKMYILTGVCGSGKTTVQRRLAELLDPKLCQCHDLDDIGLPDKVDDQWISGQTEAWLQVASRNATSGCSTLLSGVLCPGIAESCRSFSAAPPLRYCVFTTEDAALTRRLNQRYASQEQRDECRRVTSMSPDVLVRTMLARQSEFLGWFRESNCDWVECDTSSAPLSDTVQFVRHWMGI